VLKFIVPGVLVLALVVLSWMSLLRVDNMAHDVAMLQKDVEALKQQVAAGANQPGGGASSAPIATVPPAAGAVPPSAASAPPASTGQPQAYEASLPAFFTATAPGPQTVTLPLPPGTVVPAVEVLIMAVEGEGAPRIVLPAPQPSVTLRPGQPQSVTGLCQGPPTAAWVFTLDANAIRVESRECHYPVRGLKPHLRLIVRR
jgi:hypothetical protein